METGKTGKYFKYAIGEILLVVIGILIALQINNWNNYRIDRQNEKQLLSNLRQEFKTNLEELKFDHQINTKCLNALYNFLQSDKTKFTPNEIDSLNGLFTTFASFDARVGIINETISSGKLDLIQNDSLKNKLSHWTGELNDLAEDIVIRREHWLKYLLPTFRKYIPTRNIDKYAYRSDYSRDSVIKPILISKENYIKFITSLEVDGAIMDHYLNQSYVYINEKSIQSYIEDIITMIDNELNYIISD
jgi:hypothetical protein